jgi:hypothetical protein
MMRYKQIAILTIAVVSLGLTGFECDSSINAPRQVRLAYFPNDVGLMWRYEMVDSSSMAIDTMFVTIIDTITLPTTGQLAKIWRFDRSAIRNHEMFDDWYVVSNDYDVDEPGLDTVFIYMWPSNFPEPWLRQILVTPFDSGNGWSLHESPHMGWPDTMHIDSVVVMGEGYVQGAVAAAIHKQYSCGDECGGDCYFRFAPGIGMVESYWQEWDIFDHPEGPQIRVFSRLYILSRSEPVR